MEKYRHGGLLKRPLFRDRMDAGRQLAERLAAYRGKEALVLGIPRGGVVVAAEVARGLESELDVLVARKIGAPGIPELAIGAVTAEGGRYLNEAVLDELHVSAAYLDAATTVAMEEARRREAALRSLRPAPRMEGRVLIVVDDGLATGATMRAAVQALRKKRPARIVVAVPVGARETVAVVKGEADEVVCLVSPESLAAISPFYHRFEPVEDDEVVRSILEWAHEGLAELPLAPTRPGR